MIKYLLALLLLLCPVLTSCSFLRAPGGSAIEQELKRLRAENEKLRKGHVIEKIVPREVTKIVEDNTAMMNWFKFIAIIGMSLSVGAGVLLRTLIPGMKWVGAVGLAIFGTMYGLALTSQIVVPYLPYLVIVAMAIFVILGTIFAIRHIDWTPDEKEGVSDLQKGLMTDKAKKLIESVNTHVPLWKLKK